MEAKEALNKPNNDSDALESVLSYIGEMGRYQKLLFIAMLPLGFFFAYVYFVQMFIAATPQRHWCKVPELEHLSLEARRNLSAPPATDSWEWDRCFTYDTNWTQVLETMLPPSNDTPLIPCQHGWDFEFTDIPYATIVSEREWVCDKASNVPTAQAVFFVGALVGGVLFGWIADNFGRVPALVGCNLIGAIGGIATIFTTDVWDFVLCRFLVGMSFDNVFMMMYILVLEYVGPRYRTAVANMSIALYFGAGAVSLPWIALWLKDWRMLIWVTSMPMFLVLLMPLCVPESARWLLTRGRVNQAVEVLRKFEKINKSKVPDDVMDEFIVSANQTKQERESLLVLMRSPWLRLTMVLMIVVYMGCAIIFDGLVRMSEAFGLDFFIQFTLTSATEIPSITLLAFVLDRWGRRNLTVYPLGISSILILVAIWVPKGIPQAGLAITARFCINMCYNAVIQWATELLPTPVRASGSSTLHMTGYAAAFMSPYIVYSERIWTGLPLMILGLIGVVCAGLTLMLPETNGRPMPQTMADGEKIVRGGMICGKPEEVEDMDWELKNKQNVA